MARRSSPEISAGSMADIAFLLLIFFLVTTTMEKEAVIMRILPEINNESTEEVQRRNVIDILVNDENKILFKGELVLMSELKDKLMEVILNESDKKDWPQNIELDYEKLQGLVDKAKGELEKADQYTLEAKESNLKKAQLRLETYEIFGADFKKSAHVVSIQSTRGADYKTYIELSDQVLLAYKAMKEKLAKKRLNKNWSELTSKEKEMLSLVYPTNVSEAATVKGASN
jgi:biopolymer transport protein ExbD